MASVTPFSLATSLRGTLPEAPLDARALMRVAKNPRCNRLAALTMVHSSPAKAVEHLFGLNPNEAQSPFAITKGNRFEQIQTENGATRLITALQAANILGPSDVSVRNIALETAFIKDPVKRRRRAVDLTDQILKQKAQGDPAAPALVLQAALEVQIAGTYAAVLYPDCMAARASDPSYQKGELKSYAYLHHLTDKKDVGQACGQLGIYGVASENRMRYLRLSHIEPETGFIALAKPGSMQSIAKPQNIKRDLNTARRVIAIRPQLLSDVGQTLGKGQALDQANNLMKLTPCYTGQCKTFCAMHPICQHEAREQSNPSLLGPEVESLLAGAGCTLDRAWQLCSGSQPANSIEAALALQLQAAQQAWRAA